MTYLLGTDEAGYGPNLGPLVVSASVWEVPDDQSIDGLYQRLDGAVARSPARGRAAGDAPPVIADSKKVYHPDGGLAGLERGLLAALGTLGHRPRRWDDLWRALAPDSAAAREAQPWLAGYDCAVPLHLEEAQADPLVQRLAAGLTQAGVRLAGLRSRVVFPAEFNAIVARFDNKSTALSHVTLGLAAELIAPLPDGLIRVVSDKHGGRNRYAGVLDDVFPGHFIEIHGEGLAESVYWFGPPERRIEFRFRSRGENCLPVALASMASKYLRELAMHAFNAFWTARIPGLKPTAGYPADAARFRKAIEPQRSALGIAEESLWRYR